RDLGIAGVLDRVLEALWKLGQVEVHPGQVWLHVAPGDQRAVIAVDDAAQHMQPRVGPHQRAAPFIFDRAANSGSRRRYRVAFRRDQVLLVALAYPDDAGLDAAPQEHAVVRRLAAAARVKRGTVENDPVNRVRALAARTAAR